VPPNSFAPSGSTDGRDAGSTATAAEIRQQPQLWRLVAAEAERRRGSTDDFLRPLLSDQRARIMLSGAGTSAFAGQVLAPALTGRLRRRVDAVATTDIVSSPRAVLGEDVPTLLVSLARSGDSQESTAATAIADELLSSVRHLVITCNSYGQLAKAHSARGRHGPKAFLEQGTLCFVFVSADPYSRRYDEDIADELRHALGDEHVVEVSVHAGSGRPAWHIGDLGHIADSLIAVPYAVLAQQFALLASVEHGLAPDNPFPSGELSRVVRGINIYALPRPT
jgi:fructoselysine-6-P-deglycase FrlB-like protein